KSAVLIGHSMGVNVSLEFARHHPEIVKGLVLISGTVIPPHDVMFDSNIVEVLAPSIEWLTKRFPKQFETIWKTSYLNPIAREVVLRGGFNTDRVPDEFVQVYMKRIGELPPEIFFQLMNEMKYHDIINYLEGIHHPSLIIGGDHD